MKKIVFFILSGFAAASVALAQPAIKVSKETHDFGDVTEGKMASYEFEITNTGNQPLIISNVQASCGCTSPHWTREAIMPGKSGVVKATYNSQGRPGIFSKSLTIMSNSNNGNKIVYIKGNVVKKEDRVYTEEQKAKSAKISIEKTSLKVGKLEINQKGIARIPVTNNGLSPLEIDNVTSPCNCTTFNLSKGAIAPGETGVLEVSIAPRQKGPFREQLSISSSDIINPLFSVFLEGEAFDTFNSGGMKEGQGNNIFK
jgi:hypothetical protein